MQINRPQNRTAWVAFHDSVNGETAIDIMDEIGGWGTTAKAFKDGFSRLGKNERVKLHINSPGGDITEGFEIYNLLNAHEGNVHVSLGAMTASIATVIAMAGDEISIAKNGRMVVHNPWCYALGEPADLRKMADIMDGMKGDILDAYKAQTGKGVRELSAMMDEETWMNADEALAAGFVDSIEGDEDNTANNFDLSRFKNALKFCKPANENDPPEGQGNAGNGNRPVRLRDLQNATAAKPKLSKPQGKIEMTPEEKAALEAKNKAEIQAGIRAAREAEAKRNKEIKATLVTVLKRDNKDFSDLAEEFYADPEKTLNDFYAALASSTKFKAVGVVGSGVEVIEEPLDRFRGTAGFQVVNNEAVKEEIDRWRNGPRHNFSLNINISSGFRNATQTSTATSGSGMTSIERLPGVVELGVRPLTIEDLIADGATSNTTVRYPQEVTYTQAGATFAETGALPNVSMTYNEVDANVKDVGAYVEMSENLMADYPALASFINQRLPYQVDRTVDDQLLNGDGTGTNITGILNQSGIQTAAVGTLSRVDLGLRLQTLVRWQAMTAGQAQGGFEPDGYVIHPTDWETLVLTKDVNGQYLARGPFTGSYGNPSEFGTGVASLVEYYTFWGKKVVISPVTAQGTIVCGAWKMGAQKFQRQGLSIEMTNANGTNFIQRVVTVRGARRLALACYRPASFATGTGF